MDRRTFLKGGIVAASAALAGGSLAACSPSQSKASDDSAQSNKLTSENWYGSPQDISSMDIEETRETELLICGCGGGGIVASAIAAQQGIQVTCIEKGSSAGTIKSDLGVIGARGDAATGVIVDKTAVLMEHTRYANGWCNPAVTRVWTEESGETFDWLTDTVAEFGATPYFETDTDDYRHGCWPVYPTDHGFHYQYTDEERAEAQEKAGGSVDPAALAKALPSIGDYVVKKAVEWGADIQYLTSLVQLEQDGTGKVTGAIVEKDGSYLRVNASKGVILATGGYEADADLLKTLNPEGASIGGYNMSQMGCNGDGIKAGIWAGGVKDEIPTFMTFRRAAIAPETPLGSPYNGMTCWMGDQPFLQVNMRGERVCGETSPYDYPLHVATQHPENKLASIWDSDYQEHIKAFHTIGCSRINPSPTVSPDGVPTGEGLGFDANDGMIFAALEAGVIKKADTLEELAEQLLIPPDTFAATVARYNELCAKGKDEDFGKPSKDLLSLAKPPYWGAYFGGHVLCTCDGLKINENMQVVDQDKQPIEGLYAVGNCSGSMYAGTYPELFIGNAMGRTMTFARHAVLHIAGSL